MQSKIETTMKFYNAMKLALETGEFKPLQDLCAEYADKLVYNVNELDEGFSKGNFDVSTIEMCKNDNEVVELFIYLREERKELFDYFRVTTYSVRTDEDSFHSYGEPQASVSEVVTKDMIPNCKKLYKKVMEVIGNRKGEIVVEDVVNIEDIEDE